MGFGVVKSKQEMNEFFSGIIRQCANVLPRPKVRLAWWSYHPLEQVVIKYCLVRKEKLFNASPTKEDEPQPGVHALLYCSLDSRRSALLVQDIEVYKNKCWD